MPKKFTQKEFLEKVHKNNKNDIDYSKFVYDGNNKPSLCKCNVCGHEWKPIPMSLFKGHGCPKCAIEHKARKLSKKQEKLIEEFKKVHGDKYIYDLVKYKNERDIYFNNVDDLIKYIKVYETRTDYKKSV